MGQERVCRELEDRCDVPRQTGMPAAGRMEEVAIRGLGPRREGRGLREADSGEQEQKFIGQETLRHLSAFLSQHAGGEAVVSMHLGMASGENRSTTRVGIQAREDDALIVLLIYLIPVDDGRSLARAARWHAAHDERVIFTKGILREARELTAQGGAAVGTHSSQSLRYLLGITCAHQAEVEEVHDSRPSERHRRTKAQRHFTTRFGREVIQDIREESPVSFVLELDDIGLRERHPSRNVEEQTVGISALHVHVVEDHTNRRKGQSVCFFLGQAVEAAVGQMRPERLDHEPFGSVHRGGVKGHTHGCFSLRRDGCKNTTWQ